MFTGKMFLWTELPSAVTTEAQWDLFYARILNLVNSNLMSFNTVILRVIDPLYSYGTSSPAWNISFDSVFYKSFMSKVPSGIKLMLYPYVLDTYNQDNWKLAMGTDSSIEGVFKFTAQWNAFMNKDMFVGIMVDGEERRGYIDQLTLVPQFKTKYNIGQFNYCTGYTQVGVLDAWKDYIDDVYLQMYDFYYDNVVPVTLVQNSDVPMNDANAFIDILNSKVWSRFLSWYTNPRVKFMWSMQNISSGECLYTDDQPCGIKNDFGYWSLNGFLNFLVTLEKRVPQFATNQHGVFQFSFLPNSWLTQ